MPIIKDRIIVKNYKCFDDTGGGFDQIYPINIIIGKNNSGKSSLIDLVQFIVNPNRAFIETGRDKSTSGVFITHNLTEDDIASAFRKRDRASRNPKENDFEYGKMFIDTGYVYSIDEGNNKKYLKVEKDYLNVFLPHIESLLSRMQKPFINKVFCNITAERDIVPEKRNKEMYFLPNGIGATNYVHQIISRKGKNFNIIEKELLEEINKIVKPDIEFTRILTQDDDNEIWELLFEDQEKKRIALSKMGSGLKTVLLVLLNLIVRPKIEEKKKSDYVFAFEELENNLHPALQRRLYQYIIDYREIHSSYFFLTTHSNIVIDAFSSYKYAQMMHVTNDKNKSTTTTIFEYHEKDKILNDLGIKASDLLQSNGIIWVEGPSDRNYLNRWIELTDSRLKEGFHYSIMFYGGRNLANVSLDYDWINKEIIPLLKINKNAFVVIDRDGASEITPLNETKERIRNEIGEDNCWVTAGREIENYLSNETIINWLKSVYEFDANLKNDMDSKLEDNIVFANDMIHFKYNSNKTRYSSEIRDFIDENSLYLYDLQKKLKILVGFIKKWNSME